MLECPNCKNYEETSSFQSSGSHFTCTSCKCRFELLENEKIHILYKPLPHVIYVIFSLITAIALGITIDNKTYFYLFLCVAFFINLYYAWKLKIVFDTKKICLLSKDLSVTELMWGVGVVLLNLGGACIFSYALLKSFLD